LEIFLRAFSCYLAPAAANERYSFDMPGQRRTVGGRARGSWLARLAGIGVIVVVAAGGVTAYLVTMHPLGAGSKALPSRVVSYETVGLLAQDAQPHSSAQLMELLDMHGEVRFSPVSQVEQQSGSGQWTADLMVGGSYIFIFVGSDDCLGATGSAGHPKLVLQHCNLQANQRWRRVGSGTIAQAHSFYRYANMADGACISEGGELPGRIPSASLATCATSATGQLLAFWWSAGSAA
jgi:hypothetical protein